MSARNVTVSNVFHTMIHAIEYLNIYMWQATDTYSIFIYITYEIRKSLKIMARQK